MQTIQMLADNTRSKKKYQLEKKADFYTEPLRDIEKYINNEESVAGIGMAFDFLSSWFHYNYIYTFLSDDVGIANDSSLLAKSTLLGIEANNWYFFLGKNHEKYHRAILFDYAIKHLAQSLLLGWDSLAVRYGHLLIEMLYGKQYQGGHSAYKHPWFMLELFCKWQRIKLDYSRLNYPKDMNLYAKALQNWDTNDEVVLSNLVNDLAEFHISASDESEKANNIPDFPSSDYFIYPVEILLWLNIRNRMGLAEYAGDNALINLSVNNWHTQEVEIPTIELVNQAKAKLRTEYPDTEFYL